MDALDLHMVTGNKNSETEESGEITDESGKSMDESKDGKDESDVYGLLLSNADI